jgi:nicotinamide mononucleotide transporter
MNGPLGWLFDAQVVIAGHAILWREIVGNLFGLASAVGGMRRRVWAWPVGIHRPATCTARRAGRCSS